MCETEVRRFRCVQQYFYNSLSYVEGSEAVHQ